MQAQIYGDYSARDDGDNPMKKRQKITDHEIAEFSSKYVRMRSFSCHTTDGYVLDYDKRNDVLLLKFQQAIEEMSGLSIGTICRAELQCLRYLAMRENAIREDRDGIREVKITTRNFDRIVKGREKFDELAENPYTHHDYGIAERFLPRSITDRRSAQKEQRERWKELKRAANAAGDKE